MFEKPLQMYSKGINSSLHTRQVSGDTLGQGIYVCAL